MMCRSFFQSFLVLSLALGSPLTIAFAQTEEKQSQLGAEDLQTLRALEEKVTQVKQQVAETKTRLRELENSVLEGKITGSKAYIEFQNKADGLFSFDRAVFKLNGETVYEIASNPKQPQNKRWVTFDSALPAGTHNLDVTLFYRGNDESIYKAFPYFKDHHFQVQSTKSFDVQFGKTTLVRLTAIDKGYFQSNIQERLHLNVEEIADWGSPQIPE